MSITAIVSAIIALGSIASLGLAIWKYYYSPKARQKKEAEKLFEQGINEHDKSKITAGFNRLNM